MAFIEYALTSQALCMGERIKAGIFRPCARTIRYSQITGALRKKFGLPDLHAVGYLVGDDDCNIADHFIYSPRDRASDISKVPLQAEYLTNVNGRVYIVENEPAKTLPEEFTITMGALLSKGFGLCNMKKLRLLEDGHEEMRIVGESRDFELKVRIPEKYKDIFNIKKIFKEVYGFLFEPEEEQPYTGHYVRSLFEGSVVRGPKILLKERPRYG